MTLKISHKIAALTIGLVVAGVGVGAFLLHNIGATSSRYEDLLEKSVAQRGAIRDLESAFKSQVQEWKDILLRGGDPKDFETYKANFENAEKDVRDRMTGLEAQLTDPGALADIKDFHTGYDELSAAYRTALEVYVKTDEDAAPAADKVVRGKDRPIRAKLADAVDRLKKDVTDGQAAAISSADAAQRNGLIVMIVAFALLAVFAWWLARSIVRPLGTLASAVARISDADAGDLTFSTGDDEIGQLGKAYKELLGYIGEVGTATEKLAAGDFTATVKPRSERDLLATRFAAVTTTLQRALGEVGTLVGAAREGRLDQRADAAAFSGTYRDVIGQVNGLMDAVRGPIDEAVRVMEKMAQRDLRSTMTVAYKGDFDRLKRAINTAMGDVSSSIGRVSSASEQLALGSSEIQRGSASLAQNTTEMASAVQAISERAGNLSSAAEQAANRARSSEKSASSMAELATAGVRRMDQLGGAMAKIKESAAATSRIMQAINEIAFQTNLLALNAAVEAARAGDAGKGFAVVAEEVRSLALRSAESASNTGKLIEESMRAADEGVQVNTEATANLHKLASEIHRVAGEISGVASVVDDQKVGLAEIRQSVGEISVATQNTAALAEESASTADVLNTHGQRLRQLVDAFQVDRNRDAGADHDAPPPAPAPSNGKNGHSNGKNGTHRNAADLLAAF